jgi:hypothetical protein
MPIIDPGDQSKSSNTTSVDGVSTLELIGETAKHVPDASIAFAKELYAKPVETAVHIGTTLTTSAAMGVALGYVLPGQRSRSHGDWCCFHNASGRTRL